VATTGDKIVGHIFFSPVALASNPEVGAAQLSPVAVEPSYQGIGIGSALIRQGLAMCKAIGWELVFLTGNPRYYSRFGFVLANPLGFTLGDPLEDPALQVFEVEPGALDGRGGPIRFHPAFDLVDEETKKGR
jgi:putative acetyltransferase